MDSCEVSNLDTLFGEAMYEKFKKDKHGMSSCRHTYPPEFLYMLMKLKKFLEGLELCGKELNCCSITKINEYINSM